MFSHIRTSKENKQIVTELTRKLNLGAENVIARLAIAHSLKNGKKLDLKNLSNSGGKEYSRKVLFGEYENIYIGMICKLYGIYKNDKDLVKYTKIHLDEGINAISRQSEILNLSDLIQRH